MNEEMIRKLWNVPWKHRKASLGDARAVPSALLALTSPDAGVRSEAYWKIDNNVVVQSDLFEAALDVVPFLVELVRERPSHGLDSIYDLLIEIGSGYAPDNVTVTGESGAKVPLRIACQKAVGIGIDIYNRDLNDEDPLVRSQAADLIERLEQFSG